MTRVVAPNRIRIDAQRKADGSWTLVHRENFDPEDTAAFEATLDLFAQFADPNVEAKREGPDAMRVTYSNVSRERCGNIICGEFLQWATMGQMKLADIMISLLAVAAQARGNAADSSRTVAGHR